MENLIKKIKKFESKKILVIGNLILDQYTLGTSSSLSPEAPVPDIEVTEDRYNSGGAGNTAVNIKTLGSEPYLIGIIGADDLGKKLGLGLRNRYVGSSGILCSGVTETLLIQRIVSSGQQIARVKRNKQIPETEEHSNHICKEFYRNLESSDVVVISDYAKGTLSEQVIKEIISASREKNKQIIIDPKPQHALAYKNASIITPNFKEACDMTGKKLELSVDNAAKLARILYKKLNLDIVLTIAEHGILLYNQDGKQHFPTHKREVRDVGGAGDTVVASLAVGLSNNLSLEEAVDFANHAGGVAVEKSGVQPVFLEEIIGDIELHHNLK